MKIKKPSRKTTIGILLLIVEMGLALSLLFNENTQATVTTQPIQTQSAADTYILPGIIAIIVAIAIVGAVLALLVTKKRA